MQVIHGEFECLIKQEGWEDDDRKLRKPLDAIYEDVPGMVMDFLHTP